MSIRRAEAKDADTLIRLVRQTVAAQSWTDEDLAKEIDRTDSVVVLAEHEGEARGYAMVRMLPDQAEILLIGVAGARRREGVGRALYAHLGSVLPGMRFWLEVRGDNADAIAFYRALGFREVGTRPQYYGDVHAILMSSE